MADVHTPQQRSYNMSCIRGRDTTIEIKVRKALFARGFRFRKNDIRLPGKPDVVLPRYKTVLFVHGCFWHRHNNCKYCTTPATRIEYWQEKFSRNIKRDNENIKKLKDAGWKVIVLWECELKRNFEDVIEKLDIDIRTE